MCARRKLIAELQTLNAAQDMGGHCLAKISSAVDACCSGLPRCHVHSGSALVDSLGCFQPCLLAQNQRSNKINRDTVPPNHLHNTLFILFFEMLYSWCAVLLTVFFVFKFFFFWKKWQGNFIVFYPSSVEHRCLSEIIRRIQCVGDGLHPWLDSPLVKQMVRDGNDNRNPTPTQPDERL
jgi:hypothetical protein